MKKGRIAFGHCGDLVRNRMRRLVVTKSHLCNRFDLDPDDLDRFLSQDYIDRSDPLWLRIDRWFREREAEFEDNERRAQS